MFTGILTFDSILRPGNQYVFTFSSGRLFEYRSEDWVLKNLRERLSNFGYVVSVNRPFFSDRYVVVVQPSVPVSLYDFLNAFDVSWKDMGYENYSFIQAEEGTVSTQPGGLPQVIPSAGEVASQTVYSMVKPFVPYLFVLAGLYLFFKVGIPQTIKRRW